MYLLDTNILSELIKKKPSLNLISNLSAKSSCYLCTSCICVMELRYGSALRDDFKLFWDKIETNILSRIAVIALNTKEVLIAGDILANLQKSGQIIGIEDILIGATAISYNFKMVTANVRHFSKIKGLMVENWIESP